MINILVSGASGIVGYGILRSLKKTNKELKLFGSSIYKDSVAEGFCDVFELAPLTRSENYINWLLSTIKNHEIKLIIPGIEDDLYEWAKHISVIENAGAKVLMNDLKLINLCKDKWEFYEFLKQHTTNSIIESSLSQSYKTLNELFGLPFLLKPRRGFGSKGIVVVKNEDDFNLAQKQSKFALMAQKFVGNENEEYTTSAFCNGKGGFFASMTLKRKLSKDGFTDRAEVVNSKEIIEVISTLCEIFKPIGPTNFQFRLHEGVFKLLEINPRISSSTSIRAAFGYNESLMAVEYYIEEKIPLQPLIREGKAVRYIEDLIFYS